MKKVIVSLALAFVLAIAGMSFAQVKLPAPEEAEGICKDVVYKAIALYKDKKAEKGQDYAFKILSSLSAVKATGAMKGTIYVYILDYSSGHPLMKAHPVNAKLIGRDLWDLQDTRGKLFVREMIDVARSETGEGWVDYWWKRHGEKEGTFKRAFIKAIPEDKLFFGAGYYILDKK